jgi:hypothetical protein
MLSMPTLLVRIAQMIRTCKRVVISCGNGSLYLLDKLNRDEKGRILSGFVVNGQWGPFILDETKRIAWIQPVPDEMNSIFAYNKILNWAVKQQVENLVDPAPIHIPTTELRPDALGVFYDGPIRPGDNEVINKIFLAQFKRKSEQGLG